MISPPHQGQGLVRNMIPLFPHIYYVVFHALMFILKFFRTRPHLNHSTSFSNCTPPSILYSYPVLLSSKPFFFFLPQMSLCLYWPPGGGRDVGVPVHEALHRRGDVPTPPGLLPASPQQLLRLLWPVPAPGRLGRPRPQSLLHLLWGFPPDELLLLPGSAQVSRVRTNVVLALLRRTPCCRPAWFLA